MDEFERRLETATGADRVSVLNELAVITQVNEPRESIRYATEALELADRLPDSPVKVDVIRNLGIGYYFLGEYNKAMEHYRRSLALAENLAYPEGIADALNNIGIIHYVWGEYDQTLDYYSRTVEIREQIGDLEGLAKGYNNLGTVFSATDRFPESRKFFSDALALYEELGNERLMASSLNNLGLLSHKMGEFDQALDQSQRVLEITERIGDRPGTADALNRIGMVHESWEDYPKALDYYQRSRSVRQDIGDRQGVATCEVNIGNTLAELGDYRRSLEYLGRALHAAREMNVKEIERDAHLALSRTYERRGNPASALQAFKQYKIVNDGLFDQETSRRIAELQTRFEVEKKDREIQLLTKYQEIQRMVRNAFLAGSILLVALVFLLYNRYRLKDRANKEIRKANEAQQIAQTEREKAARAELLHVSRVSTMGELAAALAHELNQPLTAILSNAQATRRMLPQVSTDSQELDDALGDIVQGARHASDIIQRLRELIRRGDTVREPLSINNTLVQVAAFARATADEKNVAFSMKLADHLPKVMGDRIQLQQVLLNLVHNAAEATAVAAGKDPDIEVETVLQDPETILVLVRDNGQAADDHILESMFMPFFSTKEDGLGMGLPICSSIIEAHGGRLWATRNPDRGMTFQFSLPVAAG
jgi:signal transduction histidine kinase